jgi:DNA polymerase (family 10)
MLQVKGIGPKKIRLLWKELGLESVGELYYACLENRLTLLKGFGEKTQESIKLNIEFLQQYAHHFLYAALEEIYPDIAAQLEQEKIQFAAVGAFARRELTLEKIDILIADESHQVKLETQYNRYPVQFHFCKTTEFAEKQLALSSDEAHFKKILSKIGTGKNNFKTEADIYEAAGLPFIPAELRDDRLEWELARQDHLKDLLEVKDIKGVIHTHTKYSDGMNTIGEMADLCIQKGFEYLVISDHSKSAFYANGMNEAQIEKQHREIDALNENLAPFKIYKSIESDILFDGSLDYPDAVLRSFDLVIASVHSQLKMNEEKATERLLIALENPYTTILGHMTGRLLLSRPGYPVDHNKIIDACAANRVIIELNANPHRLDIDYTWISRCQDKGVMISINPDAHNLLGISDIHYGVLAARKGGLLKQNTLNTLSKIDFERYIGSKNK